MSRGCLFLDDFKGLPWEEMVSRRPLGWIPIAALRVISAVWCRSWDCCVHSFGGCLMHRSPHFGFALGVQVGEINRGAQCIFLFPSWDVQILGIKSLRHGRADMTQQQKEMCCIFSLPFLSWVKAVSFVPSVLEHSQINYVCI